MIPRSKAQNPMKTIPPQKAHEKKLMLFLVAVFLGSVLLTIGARRLVAASFSEAATEPSVGRATATVRPAAAEVPSVPLEIDRRLDDAFRSDQVTVFGGRYADPFGERGNFTPSAPPPLLPTNADVKTTQAAAPDLLTRLTNWQRAYKEARAGGRTPPPRTTAYLYTELTPVGSVRIRGGQQIWVYVEPEKMVLPVAVGAQFYDATLTGINSDGAIFRTAAGDDKTVAWSHQPDVDMTPSAPGKDEEKSVGSDAVNGAANGETGDHDNDRRSDAPPTAAITKQQSDENLTDNSKQPPRNKATNNAPPSVGDYNALQDAVRERYRSKTKKPISRLLYESEKRFLAPAFNFENEARAINIERVADNAFAPSHYGTDDAKNDVDEVSNAARRARNEEPFELIGGAVWQRASFAYPQEQTQTTPQRDTQSSSAARPREATSSRRIAATAKPSRGLLSYASSTETKPSHAAATTTAHSEAAVPTVSAPNVSLAHTTVAVGANEKPSSAALSKPAADDAPTKPRGTNSFCDPAYIGEPISVETTRPLVFSDLIRTINSSFKANIVLDNEIQSLPVNLPFITAPWSEILRTQLELNDLDTICTQGSSIVQIAKRSKITLIQDQKRKSAPVVREVFKLRYLQPTAGGRTDLAGRVQTGASATIQSLDETIRDILRAGGDARSDVRRVPGRNEFLVAATPEQLTDIRRLFERVDRPGYQVLIKTLIYNVNEDRLRDIGSQFAAIVGTGTGNTLGGFTSLPNTGNNTGGAQTGGLNPGGIPTPGRNFEQPTGLQTIQPPTGVLGVTTLVGTAQFAYQLTLAQNRNLINIQSRPFGIVSDGDTFDLVSGVQIPVVTSTIASGAAFNFGQVQFIEASRIARITPQVAEIEEGKAGFVTLLIQLENNDIDNRNVYNGLPGVNRQSLQTVLRLRNNETAVIGGLSSDNVIRSAIKVPGFGDIPGLGWLFKRRFDQETRNRLYFAISVEVISQDQSIFGLSAPADATTAPPPAPPIVKRPFPQSPAHIPPPLAPAGAATMPGGEKP